MSHRIPLFLIGLLLAFQSQTLEATPQESDVIAADLSDLSTKFDDFVREAIDEGLLDEAGSEQTETKADELIEPDTVPLAPLEIELNCAPTYPLDFQAFTHLDQYQDLYSLREGLRGPDGAVDVQAERYLVQAQIALGLNAEALRVSSQRTDIYMVVYGKLAALMENRQPPEVTFFQHLTNCHSEAGIWLAVAQLAGDQGGGAPLLETHLSDFIRLPFQLRLNIALIVVPALDLNGERVLAQQLMTGFSEEEVRNTTQLRFMRALLEMGDDNMEAVEIVSSFLTDSQLQEPALAAMLQNERLVDPLQVDILLDQLVRKISQAKSEHEVVVSLRFALKEMGEGSRYAGMMHLAELPILQQEILQSEIRREFIESLQRDFISDDLLRNLAAIDAVVKAPRLLAREPERDGLYDSAIRLVADFGFRALAERLSKETVPDAGAAEQLAGLAFIHRDYQAVFALAQTHPGSEKINFLAAQSAIREQYRSLLKVFENRLTMEPDTILTLIEEDAASGFWMVSGDVYLASQALLDEHHMQRVRRVMRMKLNDQNTKTAATALTIANVPDALRRTRLEIESSSSEVH